MFGYAHGMATASGSIKGKRRQSSPGWAWIPFVIAVAMTPVALRAASVLALQGTDGLMLLFPFVEIVQNPVLGIPGVFADPVAQWIMYLQFPVYGFLMARIIRAKGFWFALNAIAVIHAAGIGAAYLLMHFQNPYLKVL
ncbi:MAG: hypothetical protein ACRD3F_10010 [Acidobacteriaceae bacterium]